MVIKLDARNIFAGSTVNAMERDTFAVANLLVYYRWW